MEFPFLDLSPDGNLRNLSRFARFSVRGVSTLSPPCFESCQLPRRPHFACVVVDCRWNGAHVSTGR